MVTTLVGRAALVAGIAFGAMSVPTAALAQDAPVAATQDDTSDGLAEVVVTAERRSANLQKVPLSVAAVSGDELRNLTAAGGDILELAGRVPGLYAETTTGRIFPRFYIRGLGNIDFYLGASQPVSIIHDDVVLEHVVLKSNPVYDIQNVEVLRGPQGSLFGRNTTAGIIKFDTAKPTMTWQGRAQASYGSFNTINVDAGVGGPIVEDKIAFRISGLYQHRDDWIDNTFTGTSADGTISPKKNAMGGFTERDARLQFLFTPSEALTVNMAVHVRDYDGTSTIFHRAGLKKGSNSVSAEPRDKIALDEAQNNPQAYNTRGTSLKIGYDFGGATLTSITAFEGSRGYSRGDTDGGAAANFPVAGVPNGFGQSQGRLRGLDQWTQEVRLASNGSGPFKWQVGGIYFDSRDTTEFDQRAFFLTTAARNPNQFVILRDINTSYAVFGQASYAITPDFTITGGARWTKDSKSTRLVQAVRNAAGVDQFPAAFARYVKLSDDKPSWDLSAMYQATPDLNLYARVARGFRGPTIQGRSAVFNSPFTTADSETVTSYEAGFKSNLFGNTLRLNASGFFYTVNDIQLNGNDANGNGVLFNANKAKVYGMEAEADWRPIRNLTLSAGLSLLHSEINDTRVYAQVCALNGVVVCTVKDPTIVRTIFGSPATLAQIDGNPLPNAPKYNIDLSARYDVPIGDAGKAFLASDFNMQGYTNMVLYRTEEFYAKGNFELGAKLGYTGGNGAYEIALFARNLTNEKNVKGVIENYMAPVFNEPRVIGISLSGKFR